ncbi:MAG: hypothetical protein JWO72_451 [Caulobacteraceae bacterium]|nr:hypothetical protein [Caulobacteraceae bacterium]
MKKLIRSDAVQSILGWIAWAYLEMVIKTIRWTRIGEDGLNEALDSPSGMIGCFWHGNIALSITAKPSVIERKGVRILISMSPDGEFITRAMVRHRMPAIRGSSTKNSGRSGKTKGGAAAYREALDWLDAGGILVVTPDGPRGPAEQMAGGTVRLARRTGAPVFLMGLAARPAARLKTWDRTKLPRPFGRGAIIWDGPYRCPKDATDEDMERLSRDWGAALTAACARAEAVIA